MKRVAVVGPRRGVDHTRVEAFLDRLHTGVTVVSGGDHGTDKMAEDGWLARGGRVISFRAHFLGNDTWAVAEYGLSRGDGGYITIHREPTWADRKSALLYSRSLIASKSDQVVSFVTGPVHADLTADFARCPVTWL